MAHFWPRREVPTLSSDESDEHLWDCVRQILPSDMISEMGIDESFFYCESSNVKKVVRHCPRVPREKIQSELPKVIEGPRNTEPKETASLTCFEVVLTNEATVFAFSIYEHRGQSCGVVVRDGVFLRYGKIIRVADQEECANSSYQIVMFDYDGSLGKYLINLKQTVKFIVDKFTYGTNVVVRDVEVVSFRARALLRLRVDKELVNQIDWLIERLISIFSIAVEIYD